MPSKKLTAKQQEFLQYLINYVQDTDEWPRYEEIMDHFDFKSPNSVTQYLKALHSKGHLERDVRGLRASARKSYRLADQYQPTSEGIPVKGVISAGTLQEAIGADLGTITLDYIFPNLDAVFALRVTGDSMQGVDIEDGDYVLLIQDEIPEGGIGAVLYNGETSLKRVFCNDTEGMRLEAANPAYRDIHIEPGEFEEVTIIGRYVGHVDKEKGVYRRLALGSSRRAGP